MLYSHISVLRKPMFRILKIMALILTKSLAGPSVKLKYGASHFKMGTAEH